MNKKLLIYAFAVAVAASSIAYAQSVRVAGGGGQQSDAQSSGRMVKHNFNGAQQLLSDILIQEQLILIETTEVLEKKQAVILEHCTARMWYMSKAQQDYEKFEVYDMDKNMPSPSRWDQVRKAPSMVKDLLNVTPAQEAEIAKIMVTQHSDDAKNMTNMKGLDFVRARLLGLQNRVPDVMNVLTASQQKEWKTIYDKAHAAMQRAYETGKP